MKRFLALLLAVGLTACSGAYLPHTAPNAVYSETSRTANLVTVKVVNDFPHNQVSATVLQFCGGQSEYGPMQPNNVQLGRAGLASIPPATNEISGVLPASCFNGVAKTVLITFNEEDYLVYCQLVIAPGYIFYLGQHGPFAKCALQTTGPRSATFTFNIKL